MDTRSIFYSDENCLELGRISTSVKLILNFHENIAMILSYHLHLQVFTFVFLKSQESKKQKKKKPHNNTWILNSLVFIFISPHLLFYH